MDRETNPARPGLRRALTIIFIFLALILVYYGVMSFLSPGRKLSELSEKYGTRTSEEKAQDERFFSDSAYVMMMKEKAFIQAKITMAETDSISLVLNLADSSANLEINGVKVHSASMKKIRLSKILSSGPPEVLTSMLSTPLNIVRDYATIKKEPLMIKMAPKDTSEFKPDIIPDTSDYEPVNYILESDNGLRIIVYQDVDTTASDRMNHFMFDTKDRFRIFWRSFKKVAVLKVPEYYPFIRIRLPKADAKIIYRALPRNGQIAVYI